jgi:acyl-CoA synthetase (AMP-forming)/AMP-acid ligase II
MSSQLQSETTDLATLVGPALRREPPSILDLLDDGARRPGVVRILEARSQQTVNRSDLWHRAENSARWLRSHVGAGGTVAAVLTTTVDCMACVFGAFRAGITLASLPQPARKTPLEAYGAQLSSMCSQIGATILLAEEQYIAPLEAIGIQASPFGECQRGGPPVPEGAPFEFVQYTSGSTGNPRGVRLSSSALGANVLQIGSHDPDLGPSDSSCSWLPLSHDMGLIGMLFTMWATVGDLTFISPAHFLLNPRAWLSACSQFSATVSAAPNFGLELAARSLAHSQPLDLSGMRGCVTGAEPVSAASLRAFSEAAGRHGFKGDLVPAYGLAEATVAVTMAEPGPFRSHVVDPVAVADKRWTPAANGIEVVSSGQPLPGTEVRIVNDGEGIGEIQVRGPSLMRGYVGGPEHSSEEWLSTNDLGHIEDGELFVLGRSDDVIVVSGRNLYAPDLEAAATAHEVVRAGRCVAFAHDDGYVVVAERCRGDRRDGTLDAAARSVRAELSTRVGAGPAAVVLLAPGTMPKTPSGKLQRQRVRQMYEVGTLEADVSVTFGRRRVVQPAGKSRSNAEKTERR